MERVLDGQNQPAFVKIKYKNGRTVLVKRSTLTPWQLEQIENNPYKVLRMDELPREIIKTPLPLYPSEYANSVKRIHSSIFEFSRLSCPQGGSLQKNRPKIKILFDSYDSSPEKRFMEDQVRPSSSSEHRLAPLPSVSNAPHGKTLTITDRPDDTDTRKPKPSDLRIINYPYHARESPKDISGNIANFFAKNGLPSDTIKDPTFLDLINSLNSKYTPPTTAYLSDLVKNSADKIELGLDLSSRNAPFTITFGVSKNNNEAFVCTSMHYFDDFGYRQNLVHMKKWSSSRVLVGEIFKDFLDQLSKSDFENFFFNVVWRDSELERDTTHAYMIDKRYLCYFGIVSKFANAIMQHQIIQSDLSELQTFFIRLLQVKQCTSILQLILENLPTSETSREIPNPLYTNWQEASKFLDSWAQMEPHLRGFAHKHTIQYISEDSIRKLKYLQKILHAAVLSVQEMGQETSTISMVVPHIIEIGNTILRNASELEMKEKFKSVYQSYLRHYILNHQSGCYEFAALLDPRYAFSLSLYTFQRWEMIKNAMIMDIVHNDLESGNIKHLAAQILMKEFDVYQRILKAERMSLVASPFHWWNMARRRIPSLYQKARIVLAAPPCAIDADYFFGPHGKLSFLAKQMSTIELNEHLKLTASLNSFRGRGCGDVIVKLPQLRTPARVEPVNVPTIKPRILRPTRLTLMPVKRRYNPVTCSEARTTNSLETEDCAVSRPFERTLTVKERKELFDGMQHRRRIRESLMKPISKTNELNQLEEPKKEADQEYKIDFGVIPGCVDLPESNNSSNASNEEFKLPDENNIPLEKVKEEIDIDFEDEIEQKFENKLLESIISSSSASSS